MAILSYIKIMPIIFVIYLANIFWPKTTMKNLNVKFVVSFFLCLGSAFTNKVAKVEVMTSNCEDCGMGPFGSLSIRVLTYLNGSNHLKSLRIKKTIWIFRFMENLETASLIVLIILWKMISMKAQCSKIYKNSGILECCGSLLERLKSTFFKKNISYVVISYYAIFF